MLDDEKDRMETRIKQAKKNINYRMSPIKGQRSANKKKKLRLRNNIPMSTIMDENGQSVLAGPSDLQESPYNQKSFQLPMQLAYSR